MAVEFYQKALKEPNYAGVENAGGKVQIFRDKAYAQLETERDINDEGYYSGIKVSEKWHYRILNNKGAIMRAGNCRRYISEPEEIGLPIWDGSYDISWWEPGQGKTFVIATAEQLAGVWWLTTQEGDNQYGNYGKFNGQKIILGNDIALNKIANYGLWNIAAPANIWKGIGEYDERPPSFDGNGHTIYGMYGMGLFDASQNPSATTVIENVRLDKCFINVKGKFGYAGAIIGSCYSGTTIRNCHVKGVLNSEQAGGIAGNPSGTLIENCTADVEMNCAGYYAGGIIGYTSGSLTYNTVICRDCHVKGKIKTSNGWFTGGIVGLNYGLIEDCTFQGTIDCLNVNAAGGVAGGSNLIIRNCHAKGTFNFDGYNCGGFCGQNSNLIENCSFQGILTSTGSNFGGFSGAHTGGAIKECWANVDMAKIPNGNWTTAGFCPATSFCVNCYARGKITSMQDNNIYGFGVANSVYCYADMEIITNDYTLQYSAYGFVPSDLPISCYFNNSRGQFTGNNYNINLGRTAGQMRQKETFVDWPFSEELWKINPDINDGFPWLFFPEFPVFQDGMIDFIEEYYYVGAENKGRNLLIREDGSYEFV